MTVPMTLEQAVEECRRRRLGPGWITQDRGGELWHHLTKPETQAEDWWSGRTGPGMMRYLGTGAPNPDGWCETLTEVK